MRTYATRGARTKTTGHYRRPGTRTLYCGRPAGAPNDQFAGVKGWKLCARCVARLAEAEYADRLAAASPLAAAAAAFAATVEQADANRAQGAAEAEQFDRAARAVDAVEHAEQAAAGVETIEDAEALYAAQLITEAEATEGTWRGEWIGEQPDADEDDEEPTLPAVDDYTDRLTRATWRDRWIGTLRGVQLALDDYRPADPGHQGALFAI